MTTVSSGPAIETLPRVEDLDQVADLDTTYKWPDAFCGSARSRIAHFAAADVADKHRSHYTTFTQGQGDPAPVTAPATAPASERQVIPAGRVPQPPDPLSAFRSGLPSLLPSDEGLAALFTAVRERRAVVVRTPNADAEFATVTTTQSGRDTRLLGVTQRGGPRRIAELASISSEMVAWGSATAFPVMGAGTPPSATGEGVAKPEYAAITAGSATPQTLAVWTDVTNQSLSLPNFELKLRNKLARLVATGENELLRAKAAGTAGVVTQTFVAGDQAVQILRSAAIIEAALNQRPDLMLFNPGDTAAIFGSAVSNAAPAEVAELSVRLFGMLSLPLSTQPAGFVLMGAWGAGSRLVVGLAPQYFTNPYTQAKSNVTTIMLEEAVDLAVEEPEAFRTVDIVTP